MYTNEHDLIESYNETLREAYPVTIGNIRLDPVEVLRRLDPVAYRTGLIEYADELDREGLLPPEWEEWELDA